MYFPLLFTSFFFLLFTARLYTQLDQMYEWTLSQCKEQNVGEQLMLDYLHCTCAMHVLCMCYACAVHVLCMCCACALHMCIDTIVMCMDFVIF